MITCFYDFFYCCHKTTRVYPLASCILTFPCQVATMPAPSSLLWSFDSCFLMFLCFLLILMHLGCVILREHDGLRMFVTFLLLNSTHSILLTCAPDAMRAECAAFFVMHCLLVMQHFKIFASFWKISSSISISWTAIVLLCFQLNHPFDWFMSSAVRTPSVSLPSSIKLPECFFPQMLFLILKSLWLNISASLGKKSS